MKFTKDQEKMISRWRNSNPNHTELYHVYGRFSQAKINAIESCKSLEREFKSNNGRIVSHNTDFFSYAFTYVDDDKNTHLFYITPWRKIDFIVPYYMVAE